MSTTADVDVLRAVEQFLYREARLCDEHRFGEWESLWTDDAIYWVPANGDDTDPTRRVSVLFDNRSRIATRIRQLESGKRHAQSPPSRLARLVGNVEVLADDGAELTVASVFTIHESRAARHHRVGRPLRARRCGAPPTACGWSARRPASSTTTGRSRRSRSSSDRPSADVRELAVTIPTSWSPPTRADRCADGARSHRPDRRGHRRRVEHRPGDQPRPRRRGRQRRDPRPRPGDGRPHRRRDHAAGGAACVYPVDLTDAAATQAVADAVGPTSARSRSS